MLLNFWLYTIYKQTTSYQVANNMFYILFIIRYSTLVNGNIKKSVYFVIGSTVNIGKTRLNMKIVNFEKTGEDLQCLNFLGT